MQFQVTQIHFTFQVMQFKSHKYISSQTNAMRVSNVIIFECPMHSHFFFFFFFFFKIQMLFTYCKATYLQASVVAVKHYFPHT